MSKECFDKLRVDLYLSGTADKDGNGGYAALLYTIINNRPYKKLIGGYAANTTVTRMTLRALAEGLKSIRNKSIIHIYTCIPQVSAGLNKNMYIWEKKEWCRKDGELLKHADLWQQIFELLKEKALAYRVHYERPFPSQDNELLVLHTSSKYAMHAKAHLYETMIS